MELKIPITVRRHRRTPSVFSILMTTGTTSPKYVEGNTEDIVPFKDRTLVAVFDAGRALLTTLLPPSDFAHYLHN